MNDLDTITKEVDNKTKIPIKMNEPKMTASELKKEAVFLIDGSKEDLILFKKNTGQTAILLSELNEGNFIESIQKTGTNKLVFLANNSWCEIDKQLLEDGKDISKPFFDRFIMVSDYVEQLKASQGKEKEWAVYFYAVKSNSLDVVATNNLSQLFTESEKLEQLPRLKDEILNLKQRKSFFFTKFNITSSQAKLKSFLGINSAAYFFEVYRDILEDKEFMFNDAVYIWDDEYDKLKIKLPKWAKNIRFIGDSFYTIEDSIDAKGIVNGRRLTRRKKDTLKILHGNGFTSYFKDYHYLGFSNVPDNFNYQESNSGYYNRYSQIAYEPKKGSYDNILSMFKHIFGIEKITHNKKTLKRYQIGLDYVQMLITEPTLPLPILILYSAERETGKSTFPEFLKKILGTNAIKVGNKAFDSEFNEIFADKVLIWCDEALLDRKAQAEKIKDLSTSKQILVNPKGSTQYEIPFFGKFVFTSNNKKMVYVDKNSVRFWINKVPRLKKDDPLFNEKLEKEIPAFLDYLQNRKLATIRETRMHFNVNWIRTDALKETVKENEPRDVTNFRQSMKDLFLDIPENGDTIKMTLKDISNEFYNGRKDKPWIKEIITDYLGLNQSDRSVKTCKYSYLKFDKAERKTIYLESGDKNGLPTMVENTGEREYTQPIVKVSSTGRPYVFKRSDFVFSEDE